MYCVYKPAISKSYGRITDNRLEVFECIKNDHNELSYKLHVCKIYTYNQKKGEWVEKDNPGYTHVIRKDRIQHDVVTQKFSEVMFFENFDLAAITKMYMLKNVKNEYLDIIERLKKFSEKKVVNVDKPLEHYKSKIPELFI